MAATAAAATTQYQVRNQGEQFEWAKRFSAREAVGRTSEGFAGMKPINDDIEKTADN